jgi:hypothetical protein
MITSIAEPDHVDATLFPALLRRINYDAAPALSLSSSYFLYFIYFTVNIVQYYYTARALTLARKTMRLLGTAALTTLMSLKFFFNLPPSPSSGPKTEVTNQSEKDQLADL